MMKQVTIRFLPEFILSASEGDEMTKVLIQNFPNIMIIRIFLL